MSYDNSEGKGCTSTGCAGTLIVIALIITFVFGNKELGRTLMDVAIWIIIAPIMIGIVYMIFWGNKS